MRECEFLVLGLDGLEQHGHLVGFYRSNVESLLPAGVPAELGELVSEGIGVAAIVAQELPAELGAAVVAAANEAFMNAMTDGFVISAVVLLSAVAIAFTLIPTQMREAQAEFDETGFEPTGDDAPGLEPDAGGDVPLGRPTPAPVPVRSDNR